MQYNLWSRCNKRSFSFSIWDFIYLYPSKFEVCYLK